MSLALLGVVCALMLEVLRSSNSTFPCKLICKAYLHLTVGLSSKFEAVPPASPASSKLS